MGGGFRNILINISLIKYKTKILSHKKIFHFLFDLVIHKIIGVSYNQ